MLEQYRSGAIFKQGPGSFIEEVTRFALQSFKMTDQDLAAFFGLELAKMLVDECLICTSLNK